MEIKREKGYYWVTKSTTPDKREVAYYYGDNHARPWCIYNSSGDWLEKDIVNINETKIEEQITN